MNSPRLLLLAACLLGPATPGFSQAGNVVPITASALYPDRVEEIYVAPGRVTTIVIDGKGSVDTVSIGSPIVQVNYEHKLNQLQITPLVESGETNMNVRIGRTTYVFLLKVVNDVRVQYLRTFTLIGNEATDDIASAMANARALKPAEVDVMGTVRLIERARHDAVFRANYPMLKTHPLGQTYQWNDSIVYLVEVSQLADQDMLVFKVEWINRTDTALYLDVAQYGLRVANRKVPVIARYQQALNATVYPGQHEVVYLFVQGYRLQADNYWELLLPPDATAVRRMIR